MLWPLAMILISMLPAQDSGKVSEKDQLRQKALAIVEESIKALGDARFRQVQAIQSRGHYYIFKKGEMAGVAKFTDQTQLPDKSRFQLGEGKDKEVTVFDLSREKGWHMEGKKDIKEATADDMKQFHQAARHSIDNLLRKRLTETGMNFFYYGASELAGKNDADAVEMIDAENDSVVVYFDRKTFFPVRIEYVTVDIRGNKQKEATEFYNWHNIQGVMTPLRLDNFAEGQLASQLFIDEVIYNSPAALNAATYAQPVPEK